MEGPTETAVDFGESRRLRMTEIITFYGGHPLIGTWRDPDVELGSTVQFTIRAPEGAVEVAGVDTDDGEVLTISHVVWNGRVLRFHSYVPSTEYRVEYEFEPISRSEVLIRRTTSERWVRVDPTS
jgi:hypothetical protein